MDCLLEGKTVPAEEVDHRLPFHGIDDPLRLDPENLQALCKSHHSRKTRGEMIGGRTGVIVVVGPPAAGKTTYVRRRAKRGDLIVDVDALYQALSGLDLYDNPDYLLPFVASARDAVLSRLARPSDVRKAWVITTSTEQAKRLERTLAARVIELHVEPEEQQRRLAERRAEGGGSNL